MWEGKDLWHENWNSLDRRTESAEFEENWQLFTCGGHHTSGWMKTNIILAVLFRQRFSQEKN